MLLVEICKISTSSNDKIDSDDLTELRGKQSCHLNVTRFNNEVDEGI